MAHAKVSPNGVTSYSVWYVCMDSMDSFGFLEPPYQGNPRNPKSRIQVGTEILLRLTEELLCAHRVARQSYFSCQRGNLDSQTVQLNTKTGSVQNWLCKQE